MKKFLLALMAVLLLGGSLTWGITVSGTITVEATDAQKSKLNGLKLIVGQFMGGKDVSMMTEFSLPASTYSWNGYFGGEISFGIGFSKEMFYAEILKSEEWVVVDATGAEVNPMTMTLKADAEVNLTIKYKEAGGGEDDTPKATLIGKVWDGSDCLDGVTVAIGNAEGYAAQQTTQSDAGKYADKVGCSTGYEFTDLALGTYTLTYSKSGYTTQTQEVEITEAGEMTAPAVTLAAAPADYVFYGTLSYLNADNEAAYVQGATVTAYDGAGQDAAVLGTPVQTDGNGDWRITLSCLAGATVYFDAVHPDLEVAERTAAQATDLQGVEVTIACTAKTPEEPETVTLTLNANNDAWGTVTGADTYERGTSVTAKATPNEGYEFKAWKEGETEVYAEAEYPFTIEEDRTLTAVFAEKQTPPTPPVEPETVTLTLGVNDAAMGTVTGAGTYEKGTEVTVKATPNAGYRFRAWTKGEEVVSMTAGYAFTIEENLALTAVFVEKVANEDVEQAAWDIYTRGRRIVLCGNTDCRYEVYTAAGVLVKEMYTNDGSITVDRGGLYIVRRIAATGISVKKVMVR